MAPLAPTNRHGQRLRKRYGRLGEHLFTFLDHPNIAAINASERELRPTATCCKVTGGFRSTWGADFYATVRSVIGTAARRGMGADQVIRATLQGQPVVVPGCEQIRDAIAAVHNSLAMRPFNHQLSGMLQCSISAPIRTLRRLFGARITSMLEAIQSKPTTSGMAASEFTAARQATDETVARTRGPTQNNLKPAPEALSKASNAAVQFGRGNLDAVAQSTQIYLTGMQDLSRQYVTAVQGLMQHALQGTKAFAGATSLKDAMVVQVDLTHASVQLALGEGAKLQHAALKLTERVCAPLAQRATAALEQTKPSRTA
jgi:hypothetical protein